MLFTVIYFFVSFSITDGSKDADEQSVTKKAEQLSRSLRSIFEDGSKHDEIAKAYINVANSDVFSPEAELKLLKEELENYLKDRSAIAWNAKLSLEQRPLVDDENETKPEDLNNPNSHAFLRYLNVKRMSYGTTIYRDGHFGGSFEVNASQVIELRQNPNFYGVPTSSDASAIHIPTSIYNRDLELLEQIRWSDIDQQYRGNRERLKDLSFQKFCSELGFMRFFPTAPWLWEDRQTELDLFDCRNTDWYVETATVPRNLIILLDTSGSMLGQRFEISRQTIESVLGTLSDSDFFNIIQFSKTTTLLEQCTGRELVQATLRNKKLLLSRLTNISSEGKADYENALHKAFVTLMNLPDESIKWKTKEEAAKETFARKEQGIELDPDMHYITLEENVLIAPERFLHAIRKFTGNQHRMGCQDVIMLITDGAPGFYKEIFELYNKDKRVRFFSFIVGEEAKDFDQVKWMACSNRGFMAHIVSMADVQEKVQKYVRVLSKTVARQKAAFSENTPVWSSATKERMADQFAVSVSFPVVLPHGQFMGVSSVSVPLTELAQMAHPIRIGARSHFILLDANGYVLFHPQLRALETTGELKAGFNSVEFADTEIQKPYSARILSIDCSNGKVEPRELETLFALDELRHVYPQKNHYHAACIQGTPYAIVLAMPSDDVQRLKKAKSLELSEIQLNWMKGREWRLHPNWRYCLLNDSDWTLGQEGAFREYARQMRINGKMPEFCKPRKMLVERALLDLQASSGFNQLWEREWERNKKNGVHLAFFVAPSGVVRFKNQTLHDRLLYEHPERSNDSTLGVYKHFLLDLNTNGPEAHFFQRAVRQPKNRITFDINRKTRLWQTKGRKSAYGHVENESLLAIAYKSLHVGNSLVGVTGIEFLYDTLVAQLRHIGCLDNGDRTRCYLLDEHGFVIFTGNKDTKYGEFTHSNIILPELAIAAAHNWSHSGRKRKGAARGIWAQRLQYQQSQVAAHLELGRFFGQLNRVTEWTMELLLRKGFYKRIYFTDAQSICDPPTVEPTPTTTASATRVQSLIASFGSILLHFILQFGSLISTLFIPIEIVSGIQLNTFASLLKVSDGRFPCRTHSAYYLAQHEVKADSPDGALLESDSYERPCRQNAAQCAVRVFASWVPHTNLLLVMIRQDPRSHCFHHDSANHCPLSQPPAIPFGFSSNPPPILDSYEQIQPEQQVQCTISRPQERNQPIQCLRDDFLEQDDADEETCSASISLKITWTQLMSSLLLIWLTFLMLKLER